MECRSDKLAFRLAVRRVQDTLEELQAALDAGWRKYLPGNAQYDLLEKASRQIRIETADGDIVPWYASEYNQRITNPTHMELARLIGDDFAEECAKRGISLAGSFPGKYSESLEMSAEGAKACMHQEAHAGIDTKAAEIGMVGKKEESRRFILPVYMDSMHIGHFVIDFSHTHKLFGFPDPPQLAFTPHWKETERLPVVRSY